MKSFIFHKKTLLARVVGVFVVLSIVVGQVLSNPGVVMATSIPISNGSFGSGSDQDDIPFWEEKGNESDDSTLAKNPSGSSDDTASPDGGRFAKISRFNNGQDGDGSICQQINATGYESLTLKYYWRGDKDAEDNDDTGKVEYLLNGSCESADNQWMGITSHELNDGNKESTSWSTLQSLVLPTVLNNKTFFIRFRGDVSAQDESFRIDGVSVEGTLIPTDVCPNIENLQETVPEGYELVEGQCVLIPEDEKGATITIKATKIVCDNEADLPDWSDGQKMFDGITATTASEFLATKSESCRVASDWGFAWAYPGVGNPGSETVGVGGAGWNAFDTKTDTQGVATTTITLAPDTEMIWVREQFQDGYIPFADTKGTSAVSAELYCHHNVVNFDNYDYITKNRTDSAPFTDGGEFHCIAFNVPTTPAPACVPGENLLKNGGFETPDVASGGYGIFPQGTTGLEWLVDWVSAQATGIKGLEIQDHAAGDPAEGAQLAELDGDHPVKIWQEVSTIPGKEYKLTFSYSPRAGRSASDNSIQVKIDGSTLGSDLATDGSANSNTVWEPITRTFTATGATTKVEFYDNGDDTSYGGYLDDVKLSCVGDPTPTCDEGSTWNSELKQCVQNDTTSDVTMCKVDADGTKLAGWTLMLLKNKVDTVTVPSSDVDGVESNVSLNGNVPYVAIANGTWLNDRGEQNLVDAEYSTVNGWTTTMDGYTGYGADILELKINNTLGAWGPFNSLHTYARSFTMDAVGKAILGIEDSYHADNKGNLSVDIYEGYSGITGDNGCVTFTDVPFDSYTVSELNQEGWTPINPDQTKTINQPTQEITVENHFDFCPDKEGVQASSQECGGGEETPTYACSDDRDNDGDGLIDEADPACHSDHDVNNEESYTPNADSEVYEGAQCSDGKENDSDGLIDSNDPGCHSDENATDGDDTYNPDDDEESNGGNRSGSIPTGGGSVLGAFIGPAVLGENMCGEYITDYIKLGAKNDPANVSRLQTFLNEYLGLSLKVDGKYGPATFAAVKQFQIKEAGEVLNPWVGVTLKDKVATGWVYKTTRRWINMIKCPELNIPQFEKSDLIVR